MVLRPWFARISERPSEPIPVVTEQGATALASSAKPPEGNAIMQKKLWTVPDYLDSEVRKRHWPDEDYFIPDDSTL